MVSEPYPIMGLETIISNGEKMALFSAPSVMLSFVVKTSRKAIKLYQCIDKTFSEIPLKKELVMVKYLQNKIAVHPLNNEILNFRPFAESAIGKIVIDTTRHSVCHDLVHYLSIICTKDCRARSRLGEKSNTGSNCNVDFMVKNQENGRMKMSVSVTD